MKGDGICVERMVLAACQSKASKIFLELDKRGGISQFRTKAPLYDSGPFRSSFSLGRSFVGQLRILSEFTVNTSSFNRSLPFIISRHSYSLTMSVMMIMIIIVAVVAVVFILFVNLSLQACSHFSF